jgi:hypothetical protein
MFRHFSLAAGLLALAFFSYAQHQGWDMFDNVANSERGHSSGSSRTYHK